MKNILILLAVFFSSFSFIHAQTLTVLESDLAWKGKAAFNAYALSGTIDLEQASLRCEKETLSHATILINMRSIQSDNARLVKHLNSKDFFEVKRFAQAQFIMDTPILMQAGVQTVQGQLQIKGVTHPISFPLELERASGKWIMTGKMLVDRTKYGITFNSPTYFEKLKDQAIADEFELSFRLEVKQGPTSDAIEG